MNNKHRRNSLVTLILFMILTVMASWATKSEAAYGYSNSLDYTLDEFVAAAASANERQSAVLQAYIFGFQTGLLIAHEINPNQQPLCVQRFTGDHVISFLIEASAEYPDLPINYAIHLFFGITCLNQD